MENLHKNYEIIEVKEIRHPALMEYLRTRKVETQTEFLKEIHYQMNDKNYFGIGFKNDSGGYEIRNKYAKICLGKKDVSTIKNGSENVKIFEGFFDFLSFKNIEKSLENKSSDYIILNSVSMIHNIKNSLRNYEKLELYFDNDEAGREFFQKLSDKGLPITKDLPPLQGLETKSDWNDIVKQQKEISLSNLIQSAHIQAIKNHPPPKWEHALEL